MSGHGGDLLGQRFGRLIVIAYILGKWLCQCDCGNQKTLPGRRLVAGITRSCGCLHKELLGARQRTHGASDSLTWKRWRSMLSRCTMPNTKSFPRYGGRGIVVCERWLSNFENFLADMGECPGPDWTVERAETDGHYTPENCRWATRKEQNRNTSRNHLLEYQGETRCASEWAELLGLKLQTVLARLQRGWSTERALSTPAAPTARDYNK